MTLATTATEAVNATVTSAACTSSTTYLLFGESIGFWIQTGAVCLTALFAAWAVISARQTTRKKNAADVIFNSRSDENLRNGIRTIRRLNLDPDIDISSLAYSNTKNPDDANSIAYVLNHYEYVAVGLKRKIYDEDILKDSNYTTLIHMYQFCKPYIESVRRINERTTTWCELEKLAKRWVDKPIKNHR